MALANQLLEAEEVRQRVVECTLDISMVGPAVGDVGTEGPAFLVEAAVVGVHATQRVVAVGSADGEAVPRTLVARTEIVVVGSCKTRNGKASGLEGQGEVHISGQLVQTADRRITESAALYIIHWGSVDIDLIVLLIQCPVSESHR